MAKGYVIITEASRIRRVWPSTASWREGDGRRHGAVGDQKPTGHRGRRGTVTRPSCWNSNRSTRPRTWYYSDAYQEAAKLRQAAADCNGVIVSGFEMPSAPK